MPDQAPSPPKFRTMHQVAALLRVDLDALARLAEAGVLVPAGVLRQCLLYWDEEVTEVAESKPIMASIGGRLPRSPGQRFRLRVCTECESTFQPVGPNDPRCSDACRDAHRAKRAKRKKEE